MIITAARIEVTRIMLRNIDLLPQPGWLRNTDYMALYYALTGYRRLSL